MALDYAREVRNRLVDPWALCDALGLTAKAKKTSRGLLIRCPKHNDSNPSCSVRVGPDGTIQVKCHACDFAGDALHLVAQARGMSVDVPSEFRDILADAAEISGDLLLAEEIRTGKTNADRPQTPTPQREPDREYPPQQEIQDVWSAAHPCESAPAARALLESRSICPIAATQRGLLRVLPPGCDLPGWAVYGTRSWSNSGHRMIARVFDQTGTARSLRSWQVDGIAGPKRLPPHGHKAAGLVLANRAAAKMLAGKGKPDVLVICEGEPDWATWATRADEAVAIIGIGSGSWTPELAARIPKSCRVFVRTHVDQAGDKYATHVLETIGERCPAWRLTTGPSGLWIDENDKAQTGKLGSDPEADCVPANEAAKADIASRPRVLTVQQILKDAHSRAISAERPKALTTGHWKIDMLTGGIRPGFTWVLGADTSWGKSSWAIACADENLKVGARVLIVSTEDDESIYGDRLMARRSGVQAQRIRDRHLDTDDHKRIARVLSEAEKVPVYLDGRGVTFERLVHQIDRVIDAENIDLVILDYIQECHTKQRYGDDRLMFKAMAQLFRYCVKNRKRAGILLSQLTIAEAGKQPTKRDVRECKDMAHGAEVVALGWSPEQDVMSGGQLKYQAGSRVLIIDKAKDGMKGSAELDWDTDTASFKRVLRPAHEDGYEIPGFEKADFEDLDEQFDGRF